MFIVSFKLLSQNFGKWLITEISTGWLPVDGLVTIVPLLMGKIGTSLLCNFALDICLTLMLHEGHGCSTVRKTREKLCVDVKIKAFENILRTENNVWNILSDWNLSFSIGMFALFNITHIFIQYNESAVISQKVYMIVLSFTRIIVYHFPWRQWAALINDSLSPTGFSNSFLTTCQDFLTLFS